MRSILKIIKGERGYAVECIYEDKLELTMAFMALLQSFRESKDMETAMAVALDIITNEYENGVKVEEGVTIS